MGKRGRTSAEEAATANVKVIQGGFGERPQPPADLNERQAEIWHLVVASEPADFFNTETVRSMLADLCRHREAAEKVSSIINTFQADWLKAGEGAKRYHGLLKMRELETSAASRAATRLRLTNQARYTTFTAATASRNTAKGTKPWEM